MNERIFVPDGSKPKGRPPKRSPRELAQFTTRICADYEAGMSISGIAVKYGESDSYVYRWLSRAGVAFRPRGAQLGNRNKLGGRLR
jgi:DNA invertase Pin-like site-specific DNA recombinase